MQRVFWGGVPFGRADHSASLQTSLPDVTRAEQSHRRAGRTSQKPLSRIAILAQQGTPMHLNTAIPQTSAM